MDSILTSVKKMLGLTEDYEYFDADLIMHINSVFMILQQLGVGPVTGYAITDKSNTWSEFQSSNVKNIEMVKSYIYMKVKLMFDIAGMTNPLIEAYQKRCDEFEWRLNVQVDPSDKVDLSKAEILEVLYRNAVSYGYTGTKDEWLLMMAGSGGGGDAKLKNDLMASIAAGGIRVGDQFYKGEELENLWRALLDPVKGPTLSPPSVLLVPSGGLLMEKGDVKDVTFIIRFDRGSISPAYGTSGFRAGEAIGYMLNGNSVPDINCSVTVSESNDTFSAVVNYGEGEQPKDSKGDDFDAPLPAGSVTSPTLTYEFVDAIWSNQSDITRITKEPILSKSVGTKTFKFPAQTVANPECFDVPKSWNIFKIEVFNDITQRFEDDAREFTTTDVVHQDAAGRDVAYTRYTDNRGIKAGPRDIKITWN